MAIVYFDNFKFDNTNITIPATEWGVFDSQGTVNVTSSYTKNGYSPNGLDLSITADSAVNGYTYVTKNNIALTSGDSNVFVENSNGRTTVGFHIDQYPYSGSDVLEPQAKADMSVYSNTTSLKAVYSGDGKYLVTSRYDTGTSSLIVEYYIKNSDGTFGNPTTLRTLATTNNIYNDIKFSPDGHYLMVVTTTGIFVYKKTVNGGFASVTPTLPTSAITSACFVGNNNIVVSTTSTPYMYFYTRTIDTDIWTKSADPTTLPVGAVYKVASSQQWSGYVYGIINTSPYIVMYYFAGGTPSSQTFSATLPAKPTCIDTSTTQYLALGYSSSPYLQVMSYNGSATQTIDVLPTSSVSSLSFSPDTLTLVVNASTSLTYRLDASGNATVKNISNTLPAIKMLNSSFSADGNFMSFTSAVSPYIYTYDRQVNTIAVLSANDSGSTVSNNYDYSGSTRFSVVKKDDVIFGRLYDSINGIVTVTRGLNASYCNCDSNFSDSYIQMTVYSTTSNCYGYVYVNNKPQSIIGGSSTYNLYVNSLNSLVNGPVSLTFKRDINTQTTETITFNVTDLYIADGSGAENTTQLGTVTIQSEPLLSDNTVQWNSTGSNNYGVLSNNPPSSDSYVYSSTSGASDVLDIDITSEDSNLLASKISVIAKVSGPGVETLSLSNMKDIKNFTPSISFSQFDYVYEPYAAYVAYAQSDSSNASFGVRRIDFSNLISTQLPIVGGTSGVSGNCVTLSPDSLYLVGGYAAAPYIEVFKNDFSSLTSSYNDNFTKVSGVFPEITSPVTHVDFSPNGNYFVITTATTVSLYKQTNGTFSQIANFGFTNATCIKFSKGGKYLFIGSSTTGASRVVYINTTNDSTTVLSQVTESYTSIDTVAYTDGSLEYVVLGKSISPYISMYKINNDNTFTQAVLSGTITSAPNQVIFPKTMSSSSFVYVTFDQGSTTTYKAQYSVSTNTIGAVNTQAYTLPSNLKNATYINDSAIVFSCSNGYIYYQWAGSSYPFSGTYTAQTVINGIPSLKNISTVYQFRNNDSKIKYSRN